MILEDPATIVSFRTNRSGVNTAIRLAILSYYQFNNHIIPAVYSDSSYDKADPEQNVQDNYRGSIID